MRLACFTELVPSDNLETKLQGAFQLSVARLERVPNANHCIQNEQDCALLGKRDLCNYISLTCVFAYRCSLT